MSDFPFWHIVSGGGSSGGSGGKDGVGISSMNINDKGELVITLTDGRVRNLGRIVGADGAVYVPHIDDQKVLSFTIEKEPGAVPDPVGLGGSGVDSTDIATDEEVDEMLKEIFGSQSGSGGGNTGGGDDIDDSRIATDEEVREMLNEIFGKSGGNSSTGVDEAQVVTDKEVADMLKDVFGF
ncbi:MAG: hypothetical protein NC548_44060 [Lachnospiraceae bacterium]|nr:hypothetical protein [Lachnospiraceae bacterium]